MMSHTRYFLYFPAFVLITVAFLSGCAATTESDAVIDEDELSRYVPSHIGDTGTVSDVSIEELRRLNLVSTNLVSVLLQIPELEPMTVTLQVAKPSTPFGSVLLRVMEDAGFAMQLVTADQGSHYVSYGRRFSETDTGPVTDFRVSVNDIQLTREFVEKSDGIYPASLVSIAGSDFINDIDVNDSIFTEQGGEDSFVSGARSADATSAEVSEVSVNDYDRLPADKQTPRDAVIAAARQRFFESDAQRSAPDLAQFDRYRRTVMIFDDNDSLYLGDANKRSARLLVREFTDDDLLLIKACNDVDGVNQFAQSRAIRVEEEFVGHGIPVSSIFIAPCAQTNYRHPSDNSPVPVEIVHYRSKNT